MAKSAIIRNMKIAILGGGLTGLTAAYYLSEKNQITVFEKEKKLGGLASGFKNNNWLWQLERTYHHIFSNDYEIINFSKEIGYDQFVLSSPITASLYNHNKIYALDTPLDLLRFPLLKFFDKIRSGLVIVGLKFSPFLPIFEKVTSEEFLKKSMGERAWISLWQELFRKKYGKYAGIILTSFFWARIKKRTKKLGYPNKGFQGLIDHLTNRLNDLRVKILINHPVSNIKRKGNKYLVDGQLFDIVINTLPTPIITEIAKNIFPANYVNRFKKIKYLNAITVVLETDKPILEKTYWLNICDKNIPLMIVAQHTNFVDKKNYANKHLTYVGWYVSNEDGKWKMENKNLVQFVIKNLKLISNTKLEISNYFVFRAPFAQPIFDKTFIKNKPEFITPLKNFYMANLDMTYPYDRGTNYAVKLGKDVSNLI